MASDESAKAGGRDDRLSVWALLTPDDELRVAEVIARLSARFDTTAFRPHVTMVGDVGPASDALLDEVRRVAASFGSIRARVTGVTHSPQRFRAVVVEIDDAAVTRLHHELGRWAAPDPRAFRPHVSLLYGELDEESRRAVVDDLRGWTPPGISLGSLAVVDTSGDDPAAWVTVASLELGA